ncbi:MAG: VIT domain-containing protein, partial [Arenimonas sp.]
MIRPALLATLLLVHAMPALAQDIAVPRPPLLQAKEAEKPVVLQTATIEVEVAAGLAQTTLDLVFANPNGRQLEGELAFPLRPGQEVVGFALDIDGQMRPAVPVAKAKGRQVFEAIERERVDPALLERTQGNFFRLRVYPIPANGTRRVRLSLAEPLERVDGSHRLRMPLAFAGQLDEVALRVRGARPDIDGVLGRVSFEREGRAWLARLAPRRVASDLELRWPVRGESTLQVQRFGDEMFFVAEVPVSGEPTSRKLPRHVGLLWDASASGRRRNAGVEFAVLDGYFRALGDADVSLVVLRDHADAPRDFHVAGGNWSALRAVLKATVFDGATNLGDWTPAAGIDEYLLVSDGLGNYGNGQIPTLGPAQRLYALNAAGAAADASRLQALALAHGGRAVEVSTPAEVAAAIAQLITEAPRLVGIEALGAEDVVAQSPFPQGGVLRVAGRLTHAQARVVLEFRTGGKTQHIALAPTDADATDGELVARAWAGYRLAALGAEPERNRTRIRLLGQRYGIATRETSLIVLETLEDYVRHDIAPPQALLADFQAQRREHEASEATTRAEHLEEIVEQFVARQAWWDATYPTARPALAMAGTDGRGVPPPASPASDQSAAAAAEPSGNAREIDRISVTGTRVQSQTVTESGPVVEVQPEEFQYSGATNAEKLLGMSEGTSTIALQ